MFRHSWDCPYKSVIFIQWEQFGMFISRPLLLLLLLLLLSLSLLFLFFLLLLLHNLIIQIILIVLIDIFFLHKLNSS